MGGVCTPRICLTLIATALLAAALAAFAPAAPAAWSSPVTVSSAHGAEGELALASGTAASHAIGDMVAWKHADLRPDGLFGPMGESYAFAAAPGSFGPEHALPASYNGPLVDFGSGRVGQVIYVRNGIDRNRLKVALGWVDGSFAVSQEITASVERQTATLAGDPAGCALVAWISRRRTAHREVWASVRAPNGRFGAPQLISAKANGLAVTATVGPPGHRNPMPCDMAVAFDSKRGRMLVRVRPHDRGWGPVQDIGPAAVGTENDVTPFIGRDGRVVVAWFHEQLSEGGPLGAGFTQVAVEPPGAHHFNHPQTLEREPVSQLGPPQGKPVVVSAAGRGRLVAFLARRGTPSSLGSSAVVRVSYGSRYSYSSPQTISPVGEGASDLTGAEGSFGSILTWIGIQTIGPSPPGIRTSVYAAITRAGQTRIAGAERVASGEGLSVRASSYVLGPPWIVAWIGGVSGQEIVRVSTGP
jgi:hypothetical protein